jgi:hypothetical protein
LRCGLFDFWNGKSNGEQWVDGYHHHIFHYVKIAWTCAISTYYTGGPLGDA